MGFKPNRDLVSSNLRLILRTASRNRLYSVLTVAGLALGMAAFLFIDRYVDYERSYDNFQPENLYRIQYKAYDATGAVIKDLAVCAPRIATLMAERMPEVKEATRVFSLRNIVYTYNDKKFREDRTLIVDSTFLRLFNFPLSKGDARTALMGINSMVITESMAAKYFGTEDPIGKVMDIDGYKDYVVKGVVRDVPRNAHFHFDFLISYSTMRFWWGEETNTSWDWYDLYSYVLLQPGANPEVVEKKFASIYIAERAGDARKNTREEFILQPVTEIHLNSHLNREYPSEQQGDGEAVGYLKLIAFSILFIAWINYINLATARSLERAKEVGVRKTIGAAKFELMTQFLTESVFMNTTALMFGLAIVITGIRYFNEVTDSNLDLLFLKSSLFWIRVILGFSVGAILSGLYPAFVLSSYKPVSVLKGRLRRNSTEIFIRRALVVFQFAASVLLIAGTIIVYEQLSFMRTFDTGFDSARTLVLRGPNPVNDEESGTEWANHSETFKNELLKIASVEEVSASHRIPGNELSEWMVLKKLEAPREEYKIVYWDGVDRSFFSAYHIKLLIGRVFEAGSRDTSSVVLNVTAMRLLGIKKPEDAIGREVNLGNGIKRVIGVIADYHHVAVKKDVIPIAFTLYSGAYRYYTLKMKVANYASSIAEIKKTYDNFWPKAPFDYFFLDEYYDRQYANEKTFSRVFMLFAAFGITVAVLGLFGLSSYNLLQRTKEIGIRKLMGAEISNILYILSKEFLCLVMLGIVIASPVANMIMGEWLSHFARHIEPSIWTFLLSGVIVIVAALLAVGYRVVQSANQNPVNALRNE